MEREALCSPEPHTHAPLYPGRIPEGSCQLKEKEGEKNQTGLLKMALVTVMHKHTQDCRAREALVPQAEDGLVCSAQSKGIIFKARQASSKHFTR